MVVGFVVARILTDGRLESLPEVGRKVRRRSAGDLAGGQSETICDC